MKFYEKLPVLRRERGLSQEGLADLLNVSRQAISKWESGQTYPETDKLIALSELFGVTLDSLIKDGPLRYDNGSGGSAPFPDWHAPRPRAYEYKSKRTLFGLPLVHIHLGWGLMRAKGILAIGNIATGVFSLGLLSIGLLSMGILSLGLLSSGAFALGLLLAVGSIAIGTFAVGAVAIGVFTLGALAIGMFSTGALSIASHIAVGAHASGHIAVGTEVANGARVFLDTSSAQALSNIDAGPVRDAIREEFPGLWNWIARWMTTFLRG